MTLLHVAAQLLLLRLALAATPAISPQDRLQDGDLVFQTTLSRQSRLIQIATHSRWSHMGIVILRSGEPYVLEAVGPVQLVAWPEWLTHGEGGHVAVRRLRDATHTLTPEKRTALQRVAQTYMATNRPYDAAFCWGDEKLYCSELVYKMYARSVGIRIGTVQTLRALDLTDSEIQEELRHRGPRDLCLDDSLVTPQSMFSDSHLVTVLQR